jgi:hypothetical protein
MLRGEMDVYGLMVVHPMKLLIQETDLMEQQQQLLEMVDLVWLS